MKVGFYCESPADQAAMAVFAGGLLGPRPEPMSMDLQAHSVPGFFSALGGVFRGVHYLSDAEAFVAVVDSDRTDPHALSHDTGGDHDRCRLCQVRKIITEACQYLKP